MTRILSLPHEVLHNILREVDPPDLAALICSCETLNRFIKHNRLLFKELYLTNWDDPSQGLVDESECQWADELPRLVKLKKILQSSDRDFKKSQLGFVMPTIVQLLKTARRKSLPSRNINFLTELLEPEAIDEGLLSGSSLFALAKGENGVATMHSPESQQQSSDPTLRDLVKDDNGEHNICNTDSQQQLCAKLHCLYGVPIADAVDVEPPVHAYARSRVYDLRRYTLDTFWGPFQDDGSQNVDWEKMESIMIILDYNFQTFKERTNNPLKPSWEKPFVGATPESYVPMLRISLPAELELSTDLKDPYNVTGTWMRIVCFLDYSALYAFNFDYDPPPLHEDRPSLDTQEAIRLIVMELRVTSIEPPGPEDGQALPVTQFRGTSRSMHSSWDPNANSDIRGSVRLTPEGEVRWTTFSIYQGEERWRSEGIQIGGPCSARGVMGNWFDKDYDHHGPAGPTAFWKIHDGMEEMKKRLRPRATYMD